MACSCFILDVVINRINLECIKLEKIDDLVITVAFNNDTLEIKTNRPFPLDFRSGGSYEFEAFPELLQIDMKVFPMQITVCYQEEVIATAKLTWPEYVLDQIDDSMSDVTHCKKCVLNDENNSPIGTIDIVVKLTKKEQFAPDIPDEQKKLNMEELLEKGDTFFILSKEKDTFSHILMNDYRDDSEEEQPRKPIMKKKRCPSGSDSMVSESICSSSSASGTDEDQCKCRTGETDGPLSDEQLPKCCPNCQADMSWMPKHVPCAQCGFLGLKEKNEPYNTNLTANQLLKKYAEICRIPHSSTECLVKLPTPTLTKAKSVPSIKKDKTETTPSSVPAPAPAPAPALAQATEKKSAMQKRKPKLRHPFTKCQNRIGRSRCKPYVAQSLVLKANRHENCRVGEKIVPPYMGWLWKTPNAKEKTNWKPGAINKNVKEIMNWFLKDFPTDTIPISTYAGKPRRPKPKKLDENLEPRPTLHILKKKNTYIVTLRPLKDNASLQTCVDPYLDMKPIRFRIIKHPILVALKALKRKVKDLGFRQCVCHRPVESCICRNYTDQQIVKRLVREECCKLDLPYSTNTLVLSETSDTDSEIDFAVTPPVGRIKLERLNRPDLVNVGTQYDVNDWKLVPKVKTFSGFSKLKRKTTYPIKPPVLFFTCPQNIVPPIIIPKVPKPEPKKGAKTEQKKPKKSKGKKKK